MTNPPSVASRWIIRPLALVVALLLAWGAVQTARNGYWWATAGLFTCALLAVPPIWKPMTRVRIRRSHRISAFVVLVFATLLGAAVDGERIDHARDLELEAQRDSLFEIAGDSVIRQVTADVAEGAFDRALVLAGEWMDRRSDTLNALTARAILGRDSILAIARENALLAAADSAAVDDFDTRISVYERLVTLRPSNDGYAETLTRYRQEQRAAEEAKRREEARLAHERSLAAKWSYYSSQDDMSNGTVREASIRSENSVYLGWPYDGAQRGTLTLRRHPRFGRDVIFRIERGQILCHSWSRCRVLVRFDDGRAIPWSGGESSTGSTELVFLHNYDDFVARMRNAEVVRIQPEIYQEGGHVFEFQVGGFDFEQHRR